MSAPRPDGRTDLADGRTRDARHQRDRSLLAEIPGPVVQYMERDPVQAAVRDNPQARAVRPGEQVLDRATRSRYSVPRLAFVVVSRLASWRLVNAVPSRNRLH
jgi:hypothetical protein